MGLLQRLDVKRLHDWPGAKAALDQVSFEGGHEADAGAVSFVDAAARNPYLDTARYLLDHAIRRQWTDRAGVLKSMCVAMLSCGVDHNRMLLDLIRDKPCAVQQWLSGLLSAISTERESKVRLLMVLAAVIDNDHVWKALCSVKEGFSQVGRAVLLVLDVDTDKEEAAIRQVMEALLRRRIHPDVLRLPREASEGQRDSRPGQAQLQNGLIQDQGPVTAEELPRYVRAWSAVVSGWQQSSQHIMHVEGLVFVCPIAGALAMHGHDRLAWSEVLDALSLGSKAARALL